MGKEKIINHGNLHDYINMKALIEAQANNTEYCASQNKKVSTNSSVKKLKKTKSSIRGRL